MIAKGSDDVKLVRGAWKLLVGIKDALVLVLLLLFFGGLFAALAARPAPIRDGALVIDLDGAVVEQPADADPVAAATGRGIAKEYRLRDVVRAIDAAKDDANVKVLVLDLDSFGGGYPAALVEIGDALARVRATGKPVLAYATGYTDGAYSLAANASEIWMNPFGGTLFHGAGGNQLYYKGLIDKLGVNVHVYRVGKYKSFVEPYTRADESPEAREASKALYGTLLAQWQGYVHHARPKANVAPFLATPTQPILAAGGDPAKANLAAGMVDKLGDRVAFGKRVAALAGDDDKNTLAPYRAIKLTDYIDAHPLPKAGAEIGVLTVAGDIVDGHAGPGSAAGDTITKAMLDGLAKKDLKALVVRIDSPGGSVLASEQIRTAILEAKRRKLPVVVSMGGLAASGGYWVSTAGDVVFAEPNTITGSIGIFGIIPTFENSLKKIGVTSDGVKTTPLTGQPDTIGGTTPELDQIIQAGIDNGYRQFVERVAAARHLTTARVDQIGQGRVWDGGTARQIGLVDRFGTLSDAIAEAARRAGLDPAKVHAEYLEKQPSAFAKMIARLFAGNDDAAGTSDVYTTIAADRRAVLVQALGDARRLATARSVVQARCLECAGLGGRVTRPDDEAFFTGLLARLWR